ncbi:GAP family protein [Desertihabitans aurantiacus]|uniref:GAP family protein n=1 Tax=Desertihabitans aurantiacus TaxID=2282477 RepID=UPI0013006891|nr:GAP family protein [Desertihabitans aurantiacus]
MRSELVIALAGLALLDSLNTSTLFIVMVVLLSARDPVRAGVAYAVGAVLAFLGLAVALYTGASAAEAVVSDMARWLRRGTFALLALWLLFLAYKRLRDRPRKPFLLPGWFSPLTAAPIGVAATVADLPNAFPLFLAVERLVAADLDTHVGVLALCGYTVLYALPVAALLLLGARRGARVRAGMQRITDRFLSGVARRSIPLAVGFTLAATASAAVALVV